MLQVKDFEKFGKYTLIKRLAVGGMAEIFLAQTRKTAGVSQFVALKRILPQFSSNRKFRNMFKNEGKITSHLKHANMVYNYEFGVEKGMYYIAMEYIAGCSLKNLMVRARKKVKKLPIPAIVNIARSIASALHYIHNSIDPETGRSLSLIHRDVTPHNIMIGFNGDIKLIDFGIAKVSGINLTSAGVVKGKFSYMSPEQISGGQIDNRSDIFSLGAVMWELLTGRKLFTGSNIQSIFKKIKDCKLPDITKLRPDVPSELNIILKQMLVKNLNGRYQHAEKVERNLNLFLNTKYATFSQFDFQTFVTNLYEDEIVEERKYFVTISQKISQSGSFKQSPVFQSQLDSVKNATPSIVAIKNKTSSQIEGNSINTAVRQSLNDQSHTMITQEQSYLKNIDTKQVKKTVRKKSPVFKSSATVVSPIAPIYYSKTNVISDKDFDEVDEFKSEKLDPDTVNRSVSTFDNLVSLYSQRKKSHFVSFFSLGCILVLILGVLFFTFRFIDFNKSLALLKSPLQSVSEIESPSQFNEMESEELPLSEDLSVDRQPSSDLFHIFIQTQPSGADVYLNGQKMNQQTPVLVDISRSEANQLVVVKKGYERFVVEDFSASSKDLQVRLKKIKKNKLYIP